jgi:hypothetical protein
LFLREKINAPVPGEFSGRGSLSAWRGKWRKFLIGDTAEIQDSQISLARNFDRQVCSPELQRLTETLQTIRLKILANTLLGGWMNWLVLVLLAIIVVAAVSARLSAPLLGVAVLAVAGAAGIAAWIWRNRPSHYETARRLDFVAELQDRLSTAVFMGGIADADGMIAEQRRDALARLEKVDPREIFRLKWPGNGRLAGALVLLAAGLCAYRVNHQPPLVSLLQSTARSQLVQSILAPLARALDKDLQRTIALVTMKPDTVGEETQRGDATSSSDDLWKADDKSAGADDQKDAADANAPDQQQDQMDAPGDQQGNPSGEARQQDSNSQSQESKSGNDSSDSKSQEQSEQTGPEGRQSMGQSLMQALKNMMSKSPNQQSSNRANQQPPNGEGTPQSGNSNQPGATESDKRGDSKGSSDAKQKATQTASEGAGSQQGTKELRKDQEMHPVNAVPDRVALEASGFKEQTRMKVATETGTAQLAVRDVSPRQDAVTNGAEQENIPARYRFYVQRYFEHADEGKH